MLLKSWFLIILFLTPTLVFAQSTERPIQTKIELVSALCRPSQDRQSREILLTSNPKLVNIGLLTDLNELAAAFYRLSPEQSLAIYEVATQVAIKLNDPKLIATTYYKSGRVYSASNQFSRAVDVYEKSRGYFEQARLRRDLIYVLSDLGATYFILEDYQKAKAYSEQSITLAEELRDSNAPPSALPEDYGRARALQTLADLNRRDGDHSQAIEKLQTSLTLYRQLSGGDSSYNFYIAGDLMALGRVYTEAGDSVRALSYLSKAVEIVRTLNDSDMMASLRNSIGVLYIEQEDYAQAKAQFDQSLTIYTGEKNQREASRILLNLGVIEQRQGHNDDALTNFKASLQAAESTKAVDVAIAASEGIGVVLTARKDFGGALQTFNQGLVTAKESGNRIRQTELTWRSAQVYYEKGDFTQAASLAKNAVGLARLSRSPKLLYLATTTLGESYSADKKEDAAIETLMEAVNQEESLREGVAGSNLETELFLENKVGSYDALVNLLLKRGKTVDAFLYAERAKGRVLLDVLRDGKPGLAKALTPIEKAETQRLNRRISEINDAIRKQVTSDGSALNSLYTQLDAARLEYKSFQDAIYAAHPDLRIRSGNTPVLATREMNALTTESDTAYFEYVAAKDHVFLFVLTRDKSNSVPEVKAYPIGAKPEELARKVNEFHDTLAEHRQGYGAAASQLYALLIAPAEQQLRNVNTICIVPDSFLWNVPFQALMTPGERFLIQDYAVYYAPSLSVLREMNQGVAGSKMSSSLIAFGNPVIGKDEQRNADVCPLPEAEQEVSSIAKSFGQESSKIFIGREATERTFKALAPTYSVIHLATHGVIDNREPLYSHLLLTKTEGDPENDGRLEARQIMDMNLHAELAVLSACETANGKIAPGEGVMGMSWAFFVAGTRSMLVSQWKINSISTSQLMMKFYKNLNSNTSEATDRKALALRDATVNMIKEPRYGHPFFWAGFELIGSGN
jgi:CHAT domain-containing protein